MADKIKNFFKKKQNEKKFKGAGPGKKLNAGDQHPSTSQSSGKQNKEVYKPLNRVALSTEARNAAAAAMARSQRKTEKEFNTSLAAIQAQVRRELEEEQALKSELTQTRQSSHEDFNRNLAVQGVYFRCPLISDEILPRKEWKIKVKEFLYEQLEHERSLTACLIIINCNPKEKADQCVETLSKYLENIINNPNEEKYRKIRMSNRIFCDKVKFVEGAVDFLLAAGFIEQIIDDESFLIYSQDDQNISQDNDDNTLTILLDALHCSENIPLELDRNIQVLLPSQAKRTELPPDFYRLSQDEIKKEQQLRSEALESTQILKTKAMREREELRTINKYRFTLIRVRFPDGVFLQGTFNVYEKYSDVLEFVQSCLKDEFLEFSLVEPTGHRYKIEDNEKSLYDLRLIPNVLFIFEYDLQSYNGNFLKEDILMLIQPC